MTELKKGFTKDLSNDIYHADRSHISSSGLKLLLEDPRQFEKVYVLDEPSAGKSSAAMDFGSFVHCLILEPHLLEEEFAVCRNAKVKRGAEWDKFKEANEGKTLIMESQEKIAFSAVDLYRRAKVVIGDKEKKVSSFFEKGEAEESLCGELMGIKVKVRFDYRREFAKFGSINDIKTTSFPINSKAEIEEVCKRWGYEVSAALYVDLVSQETGKQHDFFFCFINSKDNVVQLVKASDQMLEAGRTKYKEALRRLKLARETGEYYDKGVMEVDYRE